MKLLIVKLIERIPAVAGYERAATCARDCLLEVLAAWERYATEKETNDSHTDCNRHGAWVPAIPL